jgi:RimJ/RimL family protein N-acetyltransferase
MSNAYGIVREFEAAIASWSGAAYGIAVESCSAALFLSCLYRKVGYTVIPSRTYPSVPCSIINAGGRVGFEDREWQGVYELEPYQIFDGALRFKPGMYQGGLHCLSFHTKKHLAIGRGGMILTDDEAAYQWLKRARYDGRDEAPLSQSNITMTGWNFYLAPDQAARGLELFAHLKNHELPDIDSTQQNYPDLSTIPAYKSVGRLTFRPVTMDDAEMLLRWKNENDTRMNSIISQASIPIENHLKWLAGTLKDESVEFRIILLNGEPIGDLRLNHGQETEVSIRLDKAYRGNGLATRVVGMVRDENLMAKIVTHNLPSLRVFLANGYKLQEYVIGPVAYYILRKL